MKKRNAFVRALLFLLFAAGLLVQFFIPMPKAVLVPLNILGVWFLLEALGVNVIAALTGKAGGKA